MLAMVKTLLWLAFVANAFLAVSSVKSRSNVVQSSRSYSTSYSAAQSETVKKSSSRISPTGPCSHGYHHLSSSVVSSTTTTKKKTKAAQHNHLDCKSCPRNERWVSCPDTICVPKTCDEIGYLVSCIDLPPNGKCPSKPGCICVEGFVRNKEGRCVQKKSCPSCGGDFNAESGCGTNCNRLCSNYYKRDVICTDICFTNSCDCKEGYVFDEIAGNCTIPSQCTPPVKCGKNMVYDRCPISCPPRICGINDAAVDCAPIPDDYKCPEPKCRCKDGYYKNDDGECVLWEDCPPPMVCDENEVYDLCPIPCPPRVCGINDAAVLCERIPDDYECPAPKCRCQDGYYRNEDGDCVTWENCSVCNDPNEVYDECLPKNPRTCCDVNKSSKTCAIPYEDDDGSCKAGCRCADGFYRDSDGNCVTKEECQTCEGPHEFFDCGSACDNECWSLGKQNRTHCPYVNIVCNPMCYCRDGYSRNENDICVPNHKCKVPRCRKGEIYERCPQTMCSPLSCSQLGFPIDCPPTPGPRCPGKGGCICDNNYVRNDRGACVPRDQCPSCGGDPYAVSGCGVNCNRHCRDIGKEPGACIDICYENSCDCRDGFFFDDNTGKCVPPEKCTPQCGINEQYSDCIQGNCSPQNCSQLGFPIPCPDIDPRYCKGGCLCKEGFVRNNKGVCIPSTQCDSCGGDRNAISGCGVNCNKHCRDVGEEPGACIAICYENACDCRDGFFLDDNTGKCVPPHKCTPQCGINEQYSDCIQGNCSPQNCSQLGFPIPCPDIDPEYCEEGCLCKEGFVRNSKGVCIPSTECESCGGDKNAISGCGVNCGKHCREIGREPDPCIKICHVNSCDCRDGFFLDENTNKCVPPKECTPQCGKNEYYSNCIQGDCSPQECSKLGFPISCPRIDPRYCEGGCLCNEGYVRNDKGVCIPATQCDSCGGDSNAISGCGVNCNKRCRDLGQEPGPCIELCNINSCDCRDGFFFDENTNKCVPPHKCTPQCGINEQYSECIQANCSPQNCTQLGFPIPCPRIDSRYCKKGCICKEGHVRDDKGICISSQECPSCGGDSNAEAGCGGFCNRRCSDIGKEPRACTLMCEFNACDCKPGLYYDENTKKCVKPEHCTPTCGLNEEYNECTNANCAAQYCSQLGFPITCDVTDEKDCKKGCQCKSGYARNHKGVCIPVDECPSCGGDPHAVSGCGVNCNRHCSNIGKEPGVCPLICKLNSCDCREGYFYDDNKKRCVNPKHCTPTCLAQNHEVYSDCINGGCTWRNCSQYGKPVPCIKMDPKYCIGGCVCEEGYLRASNGKCIPQYNCPEACNGPHETFVDCAWNCPPQTCDSLDKAYACPLQNSDDCEPTCKCEEGYFRNSIRECITEEQCRQCMGPHEYYSCGGACDNVCSTLHQQNQTNCPIVNIKCNEMCYCEEGYARARNNTCIPIKDCEADNNVPQCGKDEVFEDCTNQICRPKTCSEVGYPLDCDSECRKGCICKDGYVKNEKGRCIPIKQCPSCGGDPKAVSGCGVNCGKRCPNNNLNPKICPRICLPNACDCRDGYVYDKNTNKCVKPQHCSPRCDDLKNEVYDSCVNGGCGWRNCSQLGGPQLCIDPIKCIQGCSCKEGHYRLDNGTCVPADQCPEPECNENERFEVCPPKVCQPQSCNEIGIPMECPAANDTCTGFPACICDNGYVRNEVGKCIPKSECTTCGGDPNAKPGCGINCRSRCPNNYINPKFCPRIVCLNQKCDCKEGYFYDINTKNCVPFDECSPRCDEQNNEVYDSCVNGGCGWKNCSQLGRPEICVRPLKCIKGCSCKEGYYRLDNGTCVPEDQCPPNCWKPNQVYDPCPPICPPQTCVGLTHIYFCPRNPINGTSECRGGCRCKPGFYENLIGECISKQDCLKCQGPNEYFSCGPACDNVCSNLDIETKKNCRIKTKRCVERCYCEDGYARNETGTCIPVCSCPGRQVTPTTPPPVTSPPVDTDKAIASVEQGNQALAGQFLYQMLQSRPGENFMVSTFSVLVALAQLALYAVGSARIQLLRLLNVENEDEIRAAFSTLIKEYNAQQEVIFNLKVKYFGNTFIPFTEEFKNDSYTVFEAQVQNIDFSNNVQAADIINTWVYNNTNGLISNLVSPGMFNADTRCVLANILYFLGDWQSQFNPDSTEARDFYLNDNNDTVSLQTMYQKGKFQYADSSLLGAQVLELPYKNDNFSLVICLPYTISGLSDMVEKLQYPENFVSTLESLEYETVEIFLPKMDISTDISDLATMLKKVNVTAPFDPYSDNFKGIVEGNENLSISDAIQKTRIIVDETGTEAAAATAVILTRSLQVHVQKTYTVNANHPFAFFIVYEDSIMFSGCYVH